MDPSFRRGGQLLVVVGALLGGLIGVALGLIVQDAGTSRAVAAPGPGYGAALAASSPSGQPEASQAADPSNPSAGNKPSGKQRDQSADRADRRDGKAGRNGEGGRDKSGDRGKDKPGKGKNE